MSDEYGFDAEISLDIDKAIKAAGDLARQMAVLGDKVDGSSKEFDKFEKNAASLASGLQGISKGGKDSVIALNQQSKAAADSAVSVGRLIDQMDKLRMAQRAQAGQGSAKVPFRDAETQYKTQAAQAAAANKQIIADEKKVRASQLAELRSAMQRRADIENTARAETRKIADQQNRDALAMGKRRLREEEAANRQRVAQEKKTAQEIDAIWKKAHDQNAVRSATGVANSARGGGTGGADPFAGLRDTVAYTDMLDRSVQGLANQRYALYDVATTFGLISVATLGASAAAIKLGGDYEKAFQQVARTTGLMGPELESMRQQLVGISTDIPVAFADVAEIATLGAQLNIANDNLDNFTKTVAQFAATTDVTVNAAAMGFGRLAQLTQTPQAEIDRLGSAIYEVGVNSVATESEILAVSQQIATAGNLAGFTNTEVVALASTLASLGVAPEQSRGAIMRVFGDITAAVGEGGDALNSFAQTSSMSAQDFATAWRDSPQEAFNAYIAGLEKVIETNGDLDTSLKNQGFRNIRDRNVLTRLANNTEVYSQALADTSRAYEENTALSEGAAIANDNLIDKLTVLVNTIKAVAAEAGQSEQLKDLVDNLTGLTKAVLEFVETPFGKTVATLVLGAAALVGGIAAVAAGAAMGKAALLAIVTALYNSQQSANGTTLSLRALTVELLRSSAAARTGSAAMNMFRGSAVGVNATLATTGVGARSAAGGMVAAAAGSRALAVGLKSILVASGVGIAIVALSSAIEAFTYNTSTAGERAKEFFGDLDGLSSALQGDTATWKATGEAISTFSNQVETSKDALTDGAQGAQNWTGQQIAMNSATTTTTKGVMDQTFAVGELTKQWALNALTTGEAGDQLVAWFTKYQTSISGMNLDFGSIITKALDPNNGGAEQYLDNLIRKQYELTESYNTLAGPAQRVTTEARANIDALQELKTIMGLTTGAVTEAAARTTVLETTAAALGIQLDSLDESAEGAADGVTTLADGLGPMVDAMFEAVSAAASVQDAMFGLGEAMGEGGTSFSEFSESGRANLAALQSTIAAMATEAGDNTGLFIQNVGGLLGQLEAMGVDVGGELGFVGTMLAELTNTQYGLNLDTSAANGSIRVFIDNAIRAAEAVAALEKRTYQAQKQMVAGSLFAGGKQPGFGTVLAPMDLSGNTAAGKAAEDQVRSLTELRNGLNSAGSAGTQAGNNLAAGFGKGRAAAQKAAGAAKKAGDAAKNATVEVRTLLDYGSDLESVFNRSFDLRFGSSQAVDSTAEALDKMQQAIVDSNQAIIDARANFDKAKQSVRDARIAIQEFDAEMRSLKSERRVLEYQLGVAVKYGDELRAGEIRAELAENTVDLKKAEADRADASKDLSTGLKEQAAAADAVKRAEAAAKVTTTGNTAAARSQRSAVLELVKSYEAQIIQLAESGLSTTELDAKTQALKEEFIRNMTQMGYSRAEATKYARAFDDLSKAIKNVPRNVTVKASTSPAQQAINEFLAKNANKQVNLRANVTGIPSNIGGGTYSPSRVNVGSGGINTPNVNTTNLKSQYVNIAGVQQQNGSNRPVWTGGYIGPGFNGGGLIPGKTPTNHKVDNVQGMGPNGPIRVQSGEFIQNSRAVRYYGLPFMNALNSMQIPKYFGGGSVGGGSAGGGGGGVQLVEILPHQVAQLLNGLRVSVQIDGREVAGTVNAYNTQGAIRGNQ